MFNYSSKTALVTGASRGIGKTISMMLAANGIKVIGVATSEESLKSIQNIDNIIPFCCDISDEKSIEKLYKFSKEHADSIDILVNNAFKPYVFDPETRKMHWQLDWSDYQSQIDGTVKSATKDSEAISVALRSLGSSISFSSSGTETFMYIETMTKSIYEVTC